MDDDAATPSRAHPWVGQYPSGVKWLLDLPLRPAYALLDDAVAAFPANPFLDFLGRRWSYAEAHAAPPPPREGGPPSASGWHRDDLDLLGCWILGTRGGEMSRVRSRCWPKADGTHRSYGPRSASPQRADRPARRAGGFRGWTLPGRRPGAISLPLGLLKARR
jgi:hypothetical protein